MEHSNSKRTIPSDDDWLCASEARYESMNSLLQSVKNDIDQLTSKIDSTQMSLSPDIHSSLEPLSKWEINSGGSEWTNTTSRGLLRRPTSRPDILENLHTGVGETVNKPMCNECKDNGNCELTDLIHYDDSNVQLMDCVISGIERNNGTSADGDEGKTWQSPSDFNLHDPFTDEVTNIDYATGLIRLPSASPFIQPLEQTDLDNLGTGGFEQDDESGESLSPAVSPTFDAFAVDEVSLNDILLSSEEPNHFTFSQNQRPSLLGDGETCCGYDKDHALTTISEASEETDDWSSSDMDSSAHSSDQQMAGLSIPSTNHVLPMSTDGLDIQSIRGEFKKSTAISSAPHSGDICETTAEESEVAISENKTPKQMMGVNQTFVFDSSKISIHDVDSEVANTVKLRPKRVELDSRNQATQRPISTGSLRLPLRSGDSTVLDSIYPEISTFSQESVVSEADSFVTVNSRLQNTGSDELYTTACSDSEMPRKVDTAYDHPNESDDCLTLSRKRMMLPRSQRHRSHVPASRGSDSSSSENEIDATVLNSTEAIIVTPKFSRLPSKIPSPLGSIPVKLVNHDAVNYFMPTNSHKSELIQSAQTTDAANNGQAFLRPDGIHPTTTQQLSNHSPNGSDSDVCMESDGSSSLEEAECNASRSTLWSPSEPSLYDQNVVESGLQKICRKPDHEQKVLTAKASNNTDTADDSISNHQSSDIDEDPFEGERQTERQIIIPVSSNKYDHTSDKIFPLEKAVGHTCLNLANKVTETSASVSLANQDVSQSKMSAVSFTVNETQLVEQNHLVKTTSDLATSADNCTAIGQLKANISNSIAGSTSYAKKTHAAVSAPGNTIETSGANTLPQPGSISALLASAPETSDTDTIVFGPNAKYYDHTDSLNAQMRRTLHVTDDRNRQFNELNQYPRSQRHNDEPEGRNALPLAAVLTSVEAIAARPSLVTSSRNNESTNRFASAYDMHSTDPESNTTTVRKDLRRNYHIIDAASSSSYNSQRVLNTSNEVNGFTASNTGQFGNITEQGHDISKQLYTERYPNNQIHSAHEYFHGETKKQPMWTYKDQQGNLTSETTKSLDKNQLYSNPDHMSMIASQCNQTDVHPIKDIKAASQRKSRIIHGDTEYFDASVKLINSPRTPLPQSAEVSFVRENFEEETPVLPTSRKTQFSESTPRIQHSVDYMNRTSNEKPLTIDECKLEGTKVPLCLATSSPQTTNRVQVKSQICLMRAPQATTPIQTAGDADAVGEPRTPNFPPQTLLAPYGARSSPPMARPKWQLKPIPSDSEIRERLRSRSRQRAEERKSCATKTAAVSLTNSRSIRTDSRYRCTDLDLVIAESRGDAIKANRKPIKSEEIYPEFKQPLSSFELKNFNKPTYNLTHRPVQSHGELHEIASADTVNRRFIGDAKSYSSLLETDIDTGENFERPVVLETDVDNLIMGFKNTSLNPSLANEFADQKTRSLFNLSLSHTPGSSYPDALTGTCPNNNRTEHVDMNTEPNWQRTKSLQGLPHREQDSSSYPSKSYYRTLSQQSKISGVGAKGLLDRLRDKARSTHELRIAQSLTKLHVPEWLDKAECLTRSAAQSRDEVGESAVAHRHVSSVVTGSSAGRMHSLEHSRPFLGSIRSPKNIRYPKSSTTAVETLAESDRLNVSEMYQPKFTRPSQELRERGSSISRLRPITSKLHSTMPTLSNNTSGNEIRPQVVPRTSRQTGQGTEIKLGPQDFLQKSEQMWGREITPLKQQIDDNENLSNRWTHDQSKLEDHQQRVKEAYENVRGRNEKTYLPTSMEKTTFKGERTQALQTTGMGQTNHQALFEDIKPADYDSGTEHSAEHNDERLRTAPAMVTRMATSSISTPVKTELKPNVSSKYPKTEQQLPVSSYAPQSSELPRSEWNSIDADGETESEVTDGLDQISDLTCLTSLVDNFASRHRALLANRPTALDHLLTGLGWWPSTPQPHHRYSPPTAAEAISIAAHEFDVDEDSHRSEFIELLAGPESHRPINLGEFALNQLTDSVKRKPEDGLLYISCGRSECTRRPVKVANAADWCACANCYTLYCSPACRSIDRQSIHDHPAVCSFARARRVCTRILRSFAPGQLSGLTALAKTGMARLGRGGILLPFALVRHAELFLERSKAIAYIVEGNIDNSVEYARSCWEKHHLPSPGGLMSPPIYLTINELEELDSTIANPCKTYAPSSSMVLLVVVCAYELIARTDGRPVHLFKQCLVVPFPAHQISGKIGQKQSGVEEQSVSPTRVTCKPSLPQTNGVMKKPDRQAIAAREAYMIRLQRTLRERGVSLRHHYPEMYTHIANFVENGVPFTPIRIIFHDFVLREEVLCTIKPMADPQIQPTRELQQHRTNSSKLDVDVYEDVVQDSKRKEVSNTKKFQRGNRLEVTHQRESKHNPPETDF